MEPLLIMADSFGLKMHEIVAASRKISKNEKTACLWVGTDPCAQFAFLPATMLSKKDQAILNRPYWIIGAIFLHTLFLYTATFVLPHPPQGKRRHGYPSDGFYFFRCVCGQWILS
jgi:hypothetical protein